MPNSFDKPQTRPAHNSDAEPFFPLNYKYSQVYIQYGIAQ